MKTNKYCRRLLSIFVLGFEDINWFDLVLRSSRLSRTQEKSRARSAAHQFSVGRRHLQSTPQQQRSWVKWALQRFFCIHASAKVHKIRTTIARKENFATFQADGVEVQILLVQKGWEGSVLLLQLQAKSQSGTLQLRNLSYRFVSNLLSCAGM